MSRRAVVLALLAATCLSGRAFAAQDPVSDGELQRRLARADSLTAILRQAEAARRANAAGRRVGYAVKSGDVALVLWEAVPHEVGRRVAERVDSVLTAFGGIPLSFLRTSVGVQMWATDTALTLQAAGLRQRRILELDWGYPREDTVAIAERLAELAYGVHYASTLDLVWRSWLQRDYGVVWTADREGEWALRALAEPDVASGVECLGGRTRGCRKWLGLDADEHPYEVRYRPEELRVRVLHRYWARYDADRQSCLDGSDAACLRFTETNRIADPVPANDVARASLLRAVRAMHGPEALRRAFADSAGSVGERLSRASGVSLDSVVREWRAWTLSRGRPERVKAGLGDALVVFITAALAVVAATRSGRWR